MIDVPDRRASGWPALIRLMTGLAVAAVLALSIAGVRGIAAARNAAVDRASGVLHQDTTARAREIEGLLVSMRADLVLLAGSLDLPTMRSELASRDPREARWRRMGAEGALLLYLRSHPAVGHVAIRTGAGADLVAAGRRGGVPVLWRAVEAAERPRADGRLTAAVTLGPGSATASGETWLEAELLAAALPVQMPEAGGVQRSCHLNDALGAPLVADPAPAHAAAPGGDADGWLTAPAQVRADGWTAPSPWNLQCREPRSAATAMLEPLAARYRLTLGLNLAIMIMALALGMLAIGQVRRRERLEARAREENRVRDVERQLFHTERLSTVGRLAAGMAHEINNPLEGMANYLSLATDAAGRGDAPEARRHLDGVRQGLDRTASIVRQVLAHAEPDRAPLAPVDLNTIVSEALEFVRSRKEFAGIRFQLDLESRALTVHGNQAMLGQVLLNLLLNACEAQEHGGEVTVRTRRAQEQVLAEVADRGPGVPPEDASRIFEPFYTTKRSTGLGLSVCHAIMRQHGGDLTVERRAGGGALFRISFPQSEGAHG